MLKYFNVSFNLRYKYKDFCEDYNILSHHKNGSIVVSSLPGLVIIKY